MLEEELVAVSLAHVVELDDLVAETGSVGYVDLEFLLLLLGLFVQQFLVCAQTGLRLGLTGLGSHPHPLELTLQGLGALALLLFLDGQAGSLLLQPARVVAFPGNAFSPVELQDPSSHIVEEISVVGHGDDGTLVLAQMRLEPLYAFGIQMVGRLVEQQHVRLLQKQAAQRHPAPFASRKVGSQGIGIRALQGVHSPLQLAVDVPAAEVLYLLGQFSLPLDEGGHLVVVHRLGELHIHLFVFPERIHNLLNAFLHHFADSLAVVQQGFLLEVSHAVAGSPDHLALIGLLDAGDDFHQSGLAGAVHTDDADLGSVEERQIDVLEDYLVVVRQDLAYPVHREYYLFIHSG